MKNAILLGAISGLAVVAAVWFTGCSPKPAEAPSNVQIIEDCYKCSACAKDIMERIQAAKDAGSE